MKYIDGVSSNEDSGNEEEDDQDQGAFSSTANNQQCLVIQKHLNHDIAEYLILLMPRPGEEGEEKSESGEEIVDTFRVIGLRRKAGESLVSEMTMT